MQLCTGSNREYGLHSCTLVWREGCGTAMHFHSPEVRLHTAAVHLRPEITGSEAVAAVAAALRE